MFIFEKAVKLNMNVPLCAARLAVVSGYRNYMFKERRLRYGIGQSTIGVTFVLQ
jgi:hypothetical protein